MKVETVSQFQEKNLKHTLLLELKQIAEFIEDEDFSAIIQIYGRKGMSLIVSRLISIISNGK